MQYHKILTNEKNQIMFVFFRKIRRAHLVKKENELLKKLRCMRILC